MACWPAQLQTTLQKKNRPRPDRGLPWITAKAEAPRVQFRTFASNAVGTHVSYHIYTPPAYHEQTATKFPVLYWLHGTEGGIRGIRPVAAHFHAGMTDLDYPPMIVVFVNGLPRRLWSDSQDGSAPVETVFITELIPHIDKSFRTIAKREGRIIEGFSMGGYGAARMGFKHPDVFAGVSNLAGGPLDREFKGPPAQTNTALRQNILQNVCSNDMKYFREISPWAIAAGNARTLRESGTKIRNVVGQSDPSLDQNRELHEHLLQLKIDHDFRIVPQVGHDPKRLLDALRKDNIDFYRQVLKLTVRSATR